MLKWEEQDESETADDDYEAWFHRFDRFPTNDLNSYSEQISINIEQISLNHNLKQFRFSLGLKFLLRLWRRRRRRRNGGSSRVSDGVDIRGGKRNENFLDPKT